MIRMYVKEAVGSRSTQTDKAANTLYVEIDVHPLTPIPVCMDGIKDENVLFVTFHQKFTGQMPRGLYRSGRKDKRCEAHVTGTTAPYDRQVFLKAPTFESVKRMWTRMCSGDLKPYKEM